MLTQFNNLLTAFNMPSVRTVDEVRTTSRDDLRKHKPNEPYRVHSTSGSTGESLFIYYSKSAVDMINRRTKKIGELVGVKKGDFWLNLFEYSSISAHSVDNAASSLGAVSIPLGVPDEKNFHLARRIISEIKPRFISGTVSIFYDLFKDSTTENIICSGSLMTDSFRKLLKDKSGAEIFDCYGCNEVGGFAIDTPNGKELVEDGLILEVLTPNGIMTQGSGKLLITDLHNTSLPFIRYRVGDNVHIYADNGKRYIRITGREDKLINFNDALISPSKLAATLIHVLGHDKFLIIISSKDGKDSCSVRLPVECSPKEVKYALKQYNIYAECTPQLKFPTTPSGKFINLIDNRKTI